MVSVRNIFWWFLCIQILSPELSGFAIWLYIFFPIFDYKFIAWVCARLKIKKSVFFGFVFFALSSIATFELIIILKCILICIIVAYIIFLINSGNASFDTPILLQAVVAVVQFFGVTFFDTQIMNPSSLAELFWGQYALTGGDQYADGLFTSLRVSGLGREPGFFSSIVISAVILYSLVNLPWSNKRKLLFKIGCFVALLCSLSKITIIAGLLFIFFRFTRCIHSRIAVPIYVSLVIVISSVSVTLLFNYTGIVDDPTLAWHGGSIFSRLLGYYFIPKMDALDFLFGVQPPYNNLSSAYPFLQMSEWWGNDKSLFDGTGFAFLVISGGVVSLLLFMTAAMFLRLSTTHIGILYIMLLTANPYTLSAFVIITYAAIVMSAKGNFTK
jgi:hypothetical protein